MRALRNCLGAALVLLTACVLAAGCGFGADGTEWAGPDVPVVGIEVRADSEDGVNIGVSAAGFEVRPDQAGGDHVQGQGHYRLVIDGEENRRFYNEWIHVPGVGAGEAEFAVELVRNDGAAYTVDGEPLRAWVPFDVPEHSHSDHDHSHGDADPVEATGAAMALGIRVTEHPDSGYDVIVDVEGLVLDGRSAGARHVDGTGHLHLYADGQKIDRLYGPAARLPVLPEGEVELSVAAFTNDHRPYVVDGVPVEASTTITVAS